MQLNTAYDVYQFKSISQIPNGPVLLKNLTANADGGRKTDRGESHCVYFIKTA
jgi:hypothetical protein